MGWDYLRRLFSITMSDSYNVGPCFGLFWEKANHFGRLDMYDVLYDIMGVVEFVADGYHC